MRKQRLKALIFTHADHDYLLHLGNAPSSWVLVSAIAKVQLHGGTRSRCIQSSPLSTPQCKQLCRLEMSHDILQNPLGVCKWSTRTKL